MTSPTPECGDALAAPGMTIVSSASASRKRKREDEKSMLGDSFIIKPHSSSIFDSSVKLTPAVILPRSYIPLQWLAGYPSRLFSTPIHIPALDVPGNVLIVKVEGERQLAAVQKVKDDVYTLYKLSTQLKMKDVRKTFSLVKKSRQAPDSLPGAGFMPGVLDSEWWSGIMVPYLDTDKAICPAQSTAKLVMGSLDLETCENIALPLPVPAIVPISLPSITDNNLENFVEPTLADILEKTRVQYFKTLYIAKTSLAYFAKSTLSRARVAVQQEDMLPSSPDSVIKLRAFLLGLHLSFDKMDIKYRKSIPQIVSEDQVDDMTVFKPGEEGYVQQWRLDTWQERLVQASDPKLWCKVEELKIRETELQIIILLEILALEREQVVSASRSSKDNQSPLKRSKKESKKKGKRKSRISTPNPKLLLDLLVDRLCIWRSIGSGSDELVEESSDQRKVIDQEHDHLRHFCVEVVLAFYASRLPEECASINKKCGGSNSRPRTPGHPKSKKETHNQIKKPSMLRAITAPATAPGTREVSVDKLAALVAADAASLPRGAVRGGTLNSRSFAKREVQISSRSGQQKKVDDELKEAINAVKKPNRVAVASGVVDESIKRVSHSKKLKKQTKNPLAKIQVMATPKRRRTIMPSQPPLLAAAEGFNGSNPHDPVYLSRALDSQTRRDGLEVAFDIIPSTSSFEMSREEWRATFSPYPGGFVTPQKKPRRLGTDLGSGNFIPSTTTRINGTLPRSLAPSVALSGVSKVMAQNSFDLMDDVSSPAGGVMLFGTDAVGETPSKPQVIAVASDVGEEKEVSIYDSLGWDDDYDL